MSVLLSVYPWAMVTVALLLARAFGPFTFSWFWCLAPALVYCLLVVGAIVWGMRRIH